MDQMPVIGLRVEGERVHPLLGRTASGEFLLSIALISPIDRRLLGLWALRLKLFFVHFLETALAGIVRHCCRITALFCSLAESI